MSCPDCDHVQEHACTDAEAPRFYVRVDDADVEILGCQRHVVAVMEAVRLANGPRPS